MSDEPAEPQVWVCTSEDREGGRMLGARSCGVPLDDRGLRYGDGLFETLRVLHGALPFWTRHLQRLRAGLKLLGFPELPLADAEIADRCRETVRRNGVAEGFLRLCVTRGGGPRGFLPTEGAGWRLIAEVGRLAGGAQPAPLDCAFAPWRIDPAYPGCELKSLSALDKVLAARHAQAVGAGEVLLRNIREELVEGTRTNVFLVAGGALCTPALECGPLPGIARGVVLELARGHGLPVREAAIPAADIAQAQEMFLTNALRGIIPGGLRGARLRPYPGASHAKALEALPRGAGIRRRGWAIGGTPGATRSKRREEVTPWPR